MGGERRLGVVGAVRQGRTGPDAVFRHTDGTEAHATRHFNGDFIDDFAESNFNVTDSELNYEDDSIRLEADWQASDALGLQAQLYQLTTDRLWRNAETYFLVGPNELERGDPLELGHDMDHNGVRTNLSFASSGDGVRASVGFEMNDVSFDRPTYSPRQNPTGITFDETDIVVRNNFSPAFAGITAPRRSCSTTRRT